jgi:hypothetical protein
VNVSLSLDTRIFTGYVLALQKKLGVDLPKVVRGEVGVILKTCVSRTKVARAADISTNARKQASRDAIKATFYGIEPGGRVGVGQAYIPYGGRKGGGNVGAVWFRGKGSSGRSFVYLGKDGRQNRIGADYQQRAMTAAAKYAQSVRIEQAKGKRAAALARGSWVQIADAAGIRLEQVRGGGNVSAIAIQKARTATASNGRRYENGTAITLTAPDRFAITVINSLPYGRAIRLDGVLRYAIDGRVKQFATLARKGLLDSAANLARQYPNQITVN